MLLKRIITSLVLFATLCYIAGVFNLAFVFVLSFAGLCYVPVFLSGAYIIQRIAPSQIRKKFEKRQISFHLIIVVSLVLLLLGRHAINRYYMPGVFYLIRISAKVGLLVVTILYGGSFLKNGWCRKTIIYTVVYLLFIFVPVIVASFRISSGKQVGASTVNHLAGIGYVDWVPADDNISKVSVSLYNPQLSCNGLNLYSRRSPGDPSELKWITTFWVENIRQVSGKRAIFGFRV